MLEIVGTVFMVVFDLMFILFAIEIPKDLSPVASGIILSVMGGIAIIGTYLIARFWYRKIKSKP